MENKLACSHKPLSQEYQPKRHSRLSSAYDYQIPRSNPWEPLAVQLRDGRVVRQEHVGVVHPCGDSPLPLGITTLPLVHMGLCTETQNVIFYGIQNVQNIVVNTW